MRKDERMDEWVMTENDVQYSYGAGTAWECVGCC